MDQHSINMSRSDNTYWLGVVRDAGVSNTDVPDDIVIAGLEKHAYNVDSFMNEWYSTQRIQLDDATMNALSQERGTARASVNLQMDTYGESAGDLSPASQQMPCPWMPGAVCEDVGEVCAENDLLRYGCTAFWCLSITVLAIILIACSVETIESTEMGIAYNTPQAILDSEVKEEGLHGKAPFGEFIVWPRTHQTMHQEVSGMSQDGVVVSVEVAFQYKVDEKNLHQLTMEYKDFDNYRSILRLKSRSGIRNACMNFKAQEFQTKRGAVQSHMFEELKKRLTQGKMSAYILDLQLTSVDRPPKYEQAVEEKEQARNNIALVENQRAQKLTIARTNLLKVKVAANKTLDSARTAAAVKDKDAQAQAAIVYGRYESQGLLYRTVRDSRGLSSEGLLAYIGTRIFDELDGITVGLSAPARMSYGANLSTVIQPTGAPSKAPTAAPSAAPTAAPSAAPTAAPTKAPTGAPVARL